MRVFLSCMVLICLYCMPALAAQKEKFIDIKELVSPGGILVWLVEDHSVPVVAMEYTFRDAGAKNDPEGKQGLAQLASNTMDEGAGELRSEQFQKTLQDLSISLSFNADRDNFGGSLKTLTQHKDKAFELLQLALTQPRFDIEPVERMRAANMSRIKSAMSNPKWMAARLQNDRLFQGHAYARNSGGTISDLGTLTPEDLRKFHKGLGKNKVVIAVAGDITAEELAPIVDRVFGPLPMVTEEAEDKTEIKNTGKTYLFKQDIPQTIIEIAQKGIGRDNPDYHAAQVMNFILGGSGFGSRLTDEIREKRGLTYGIYSFFREYEAVKVLHVSTSTENKNVSEIISLIKTEWKKIKNTPVSDKELQDAKSYLLGSLPLSLTSTDAIASMMLSLQLDMLPPDYLDKREDKIRAITSEHIQSTAKKLLDENAMNVVLVGKPQGLDNTEIVTELPNVE